MRITYEKRETQFACSEYVRWADILLEGVPSTILLGNLEALRSEMCTDSSANREAAKTRETQIRFESVERYRKQNCDHHRLLSVLQCNI